MRTVIILAALLLSTTLIALAPAADACPTAGCFGRCWVVWDDALVDGVQTPSDVECAW